MKNNHNLKETLHTVEKSAVDANTKLISIRQNAFRRFPLLFVLLSSFGLVSTFYGFEKVIDSIPVLTNNPIILLLVGIALLIFTGSLYKKLS